MPSGWRLVSDTLTPGLQGVPKYLDETVGRVMAFYAPQVESAAKVNAPWADQTGNARNGLIAKALKSSGNNYAIILAHQMPYGIWLEVKWAGRYAIIMPTIQEYGPKVMNTLRGALERYHG